ncbi:hypothetical protein F5Y16DRAFT_3697 [Xylariaceae sp. FL0255]|nr:hypothetical protein F5Y16DRAFT_3697 [Xylariaceae sp. FL0255]
MHRTQVAAVRKHPSLPPDSLSEHYAYEPMPPNLMPPIGPNLLVHFFENPTHAGTQLDLFRRVPRKVGERLGTSQISPSLSSSGDATQTGDNGSDSGILIGWGIQFEEGVDTLAFFACGVLVFLPVCWSPFYGLWHEMMFRAALG